MRSATRLPVLGGAVFLVGAGLVGLLVGPVDLGVGEIARSALSHVPFLHVHSSLPASDSAILWQLRAPRVVLGLLVGVASLLHTGRVGSASPDAGTLMELDAIAACVIGGTSLMGGRGTVSGAVVGALIMASLDNGMSLLNVENYTQYIVKGAVLVAAVGFDMLGRRKS